MSSFAMLLDRWFPVDDARVRAGINKLRGIRDADGPTNPPGVTASEAHALLNALVRYEAIAAGAAVVEPATVRNLLPLEVKP